MSRSTPPEPLDLTRLKVLPLAQRRSLTRVEDILLPPGSPAPQVDDLVAKSLARCVADVRRARERNASVMLIYGAHLLRNGVAQLVDQLLASGWITHLATNGAGTIHDWEYAWFGRSTESVRENVATGTFGTWDETGRNLHLALLAGGVRMEGLDSCRPEPQLGDRNVALPNCGEGYGAALGRLIQEDGVTLPDPAELKRQLQAEPEHPLAPARADLLRAMKQHQLAPGRHAVEHRWKHASMVASAFRHGVPMTVHPGIGYDIIANHPMFNGAVIGRAAEQDFRLFGGSVERLDGGVVLSIGSAIMGPQVFEKSLSCVNNLRLQDDRPIVSGHSLYVVDLQDGGNWDWTQGEPPKTNPAYYLRFCKSYARMGGTMHYAQCDNAAFVQHLHQQLCPA